MKEAKVKKVPSTKRFIINLSIYALVGVFTGVLIGMWMISNKVDPNLYNIDVSKLYDDVGAIQIEAKNKNPLQLGATKSCVLAFYNTFNSNKVSMTGKGSVTAMGFTQTISARAMKIDDKAFSESVSTGSVVSAADRFYLNGKNVSHLTGKINDKTVTWNTEVDELTNEEYKEKMGGDVNEFMLYIISSKTVKSESDIEVLSNGNYKFTLQLDKVKSVVKYVKNMKATGGLSSYPEFRKDIELIVEVDSNFRLVEVTSNEVYGARKAGIPITAESVGTLTNKFIYDGNFAIPEFSENTIL